MIYCMCMVLLFIGTTYSMEYQDTRKLDLSEEDKNYQTFMSDLFGGPDDLTKDLNLPTFDSSIVDLTENLDQLAIPAVPTTNTMALVQEITPHQTYQELRTLEQEMQKYEEWQKQQASIIQLRSALCHDGFYNPVTHRMAEQSFVEHTNGEIVHKMQEIITKFKRNLKTEVRKAFKDFGQPETIIKKATRISCYLATVYPNLCLHMNERGDIKIRSLLPAHDLLNCLSWDFITVNNTTHEALKSLSNLLTDKRTCSSEKNTLIRECVHRYYGSLSSQMTAHGLDEHSPYRLKAALAACELGYRLQKLPISMLKNEITRILLAFLQAEKTYAEFYKIEGYALPAGSQISDKQSYLIELFHSYQAFLTTQSYDTWLPGEEKNILEYEHELNFVSAKTIFECAKASAYGKFAQKVKESYASHADALESHQKLKKLVEHLALVYRKESCAFDKKIHLVSLQWPQYTEFYLSKNVTQQAEHDFVTIAGQVSSFYDKILSGEKAEIVWLTRSMLLGGITRSIFGSVKEVAEQNPQDVIYKASAYHALFKASQKLDELFPGMERRGHQSIKNIFEAAFNWMHPLAIKTAETTVARYQKWKQLNTVVGQ